MAQLRDSRILGTLSVDGITTVKDLIVKNDSGSSKIELNNSSNTSEATSIVMKNHRDGNNFWTIEASSDSSLKIFFNPLSTTKNLRLKLDQNGNLYTNDGTRQVWTNANLDPASKSGTTFYGNIDFTNNANIIASNGNTNGYYIKQTNGTRTLLLSINSSNEGCLGSDLLPTKLYGNTLTYHGNDVWHKGIFNPSRNIDNSTLTGTNTFRCKNNYGIYYMKTDGSEAEGWYMNNQNIFYKAGNITVGGDILSRGDVRNNTTSLNDLHARWQSLQDGVGQVFTYNVNVSYTAGVWASTGIRLPSSGTYIVSFQINTASSSGSIWNETYTGICSFFNNWTNSDVITEIPLTNSGHATNNEWVVLGFKRTMGNTMQQEFVITGTETVDNIPVNFKFRRVL